MSCNIEWLLHPVDDVGIISGRGYPQDRPDDFIYSHMIPSTWLDTIKFDKDNFQQTSTLNLCDLYSKVITK